MLQGWGEELSKPRYRWWSYVKGMVREYPAYCERLNNLHSMPVTAIITGMPRGTDVSRTTENAASRELRAIERKEYDAVRMAIATTERYSNGRDRLAIIQLVYWKRTHTLSGAALMIPCCMQTAKNWHGEFMRMVAHYFGLIE